MEEIFAYICKHVQRASSPQAMASFTRRAPSSAPAAERRGTGRWRGTPAPTLAPAQVACQHAPQSSQERQCLRSTGTSSQQGHPPSLTDDPVSHTLTAAPATPSNHSTSHHGPRLRLQPHEACSRVGHRPAQSSGKGLWPRSRRAEAVNKPPPCTGHATTMLRCHVLTTAVRMPSHWPGAPTGSGS